VGLHLFLSGGKGSGSTGKLRKEAEKLPQKMGHGRLRRINLDELVWF